MLAQLTVNLGEKHMRRLFFFKKLMEDGTFTEAKEVVKTETYKEKVK
jgi:hypothetical protein